MGEALGKKAVYTKEEYVLMEAEEVFRSEFHNGEIFSMAGGSPEHSIICSNMNRRLSEALDEKDCFVFSSDMKLDIVAANAYVYPDAMVVCGKIDMVENRKDIIKNPLLIIEVLSHSTAAYDRDKKFRYYRTLPSLKEYVLIAQDKPSVEVFYKQDDKHWIYTFAEGLDDSILLQSIQYRISLNHVYQKITWLPTPDPSSTSDASPT